MIISKTSKKIHKASNWIIWHALGRTRVMNFNLWRPAHPIVLYWLPFSYRTRFFNGVLEGHFIAFPVWNWRALECRESMKSVNWELSFSFFLLWSYKCGEIPDKLSASYDTERRRVWGRPCSQLLLCQTGCLCIGKTLEVKRLAP